jgi:hypothetical protein
MPGVRALWRPLSFCALGLALTVTALTASSDGRWKRDSNGACVFDPNDSGPDQCTAGRWKLDGAGNCYFEEHDSGPDQCTISPYQTGRRPR